MNKYIGAAVPTQESETFCVIEPLDLSFELRHWNLHL